MEWTEEIFERSGRNHLSKNLYALMLCFWTALGVGVSGAAAKVGEDMTLNLWIVLVVLAVSIAGVFISLGSSNPAVSLFGFMLIATPLGLISGPFIAEYTEASVLRVLFLTTGMVVVLGLIGAIIPDSLDGWGSWLLGGLFILLAGTFIIPLAGAFNIPIDEALTIWDVVGVLLFSGLVIYDLNRAMRLPYTHDNAIDSAVAVYLDFANIFIRLLSLTGNKRSD